MSPGDEHQKQLQGYMDLLASLYPGHQVSGHVLYYQ